jgi:regulatory protein
MNKQEELDNYTGKVSRYLSYRPRTKQEVKNYLKRKHCPGDLIQRIINDFVEEGLLNDEEFAQWWIDQRLSFKPRGKRALKSELYKKGVDSRIINKELAQIDESKLIKSARRVIKKRIDGWKGMEHLEKKKKISDYLGRRGFSWDITKRIIDEFLQKE